MQMAEFGQIFELRLQIVMQLPEAFRALIPEYKNGISGRQFRSDFSSNMTKTET
jgi:hypothetical protein